MRELSVNGYQKKEERRKKIAGWGNFSREFGTHGVGVEKRYSLGTLSSSTG
jgi:hypothetical protein